MPQFLSIYRLLRHRQGWDSTAGVHIIHIYGIIYYIHHLAEHRNKFSVPFYRENNPRGSRIFKTHFAFFR